MTFSCQVDSIPGAVKIVRRASGIALRKIIRGTVTTPGGKAA